MEFTLFTLIYQKGSTEGCHRTMSLFPPADKDCQKSPISLEEPLLLAREAQGGRILDALSHLTAFFSGQRSDFQIRDLAKLWVFCFVLIFIYLFGCRVLAVARGIFIPACGFFVAACRIFSCGMQDLVPWPGIKPRPPALGARSLNHWTTREVPKLWILLILYYSNSQYNTLDLIFSYYQPRDCKR